MKLSGFEIGSHPVQPENFPVVCAESVSYTHLDVYKRQYGDGVAASIQLSPGKTAGRPWLCQRSAIKRRIDIMEKINDIFGSLVFNDAVMRERLPKATYRALKESMETGTDPVSYTHLRERRRRN